MQDRKIWQNTRPASRQPGRGSQSCTKEVLSRSPDRQSMGWKVHHQRQQEARKKNHPRKNHQDRWSASWVRQIRQADQVLQYPSQPFSMKVISWNIRGLNSPRKCRLLKNMLMQEKSNILFLQETKCNSTVLEKIAAKAWPGGLVIVVDAQGASGGLEVLWDAWVIQLNNIHANKNFIQAIFHIIGTNTHGHMTNVYFPQETIHKAEILDTLSELNSNRLYPLWISGGDFNMIARLEENQGSRSRRNIDGNILKDFIQNNWLVDLPSNNGIFTWNNKRVGSQQIDSRLHRFLISDNATHLGGEFIASILPVSGSDHWPIAIQWNCPDNSIRCPFRFEAFWLTHLNFNEFVRSTWLKFNPSSGTKMSIFQWKLKHLKEEIKHWNHTTFGNILKHRQP